MASLIRFILNNKFRVRFRHSMHQTACVQYARCPWAILLHLKSFQLFWEQNDDFGPVAHVNRCALCVHLAIRSQHIVFTYPEIEASQLSIRRMHRIMHLFSHYCHVFSGATHFPLMTNKQYRMVKFKYYCNEQRRQHLMDIKLIRIVPLVHLHETEIELILIKSRPFRGESDLFCCFATGNGEGGAGGSDV